MNESRAQNARAAGYAMRPMRPGDADRIAEVHVQVWREAYTSLMPADYLGSLDVTRFARTWRERLAGPPSEETRLVGINPEGEIVAIAASGPSRDDAAPVAWELWAINVLRTECGTGMADLMMTELVGDRAASLWVVAGNARARSFYTRYGFAPDGATKEHGQTGTAEVRLIRARVC